MTSNEQNLAPVRADTDDAVIQHLAAGQSPTSAAAAVGVSVSSVYRRLRNPLFRARLAEARAEVLQPVVARMMGECGRSLDRLISIRDDANACDSTRVRAAVAIIDTALKLNDAVLLNLRLTSVEAALAEAGIESPTAPPPLEATAGE